MEKLKILFINSFYYPEIGGGAEVIVKLQAENLALRGHDVAILATSGVNGINIESINNVKVFRCGIKNSYWHFVKQERSSKQKLLWHVRDIYNLSMKSYVEDIVQDFQPDLVFTHNLSGWSISVIDAIKKYSNAICIEVLHDQYFKCPNVNMFRNNSLCQDQCLKCKLMRIPHKFLSKKFHGVVGVSSYVLNSMKMSGYFDAVRAKTIHNSREMSEFIKKNTLSSDTKLSFGYLGTLNGAKGIDVMLKAFQELTLDANLYIGGSGESEYVDKVKNASLSDNRIRYLGYFKPIEFFKLIDVLIVPSIWPETFSTVAIEASANCVPVIGTNSGGTEEIVFNGKNGIIIEANNSSALKDAIMYFENNREILNEMILNSPKVVEKFVDTDRMLDEYLSFYEEIKNS